MKKRTCNTSVGDIARSAGVSKTAVAFALQNRPGVSVATRQRILCIAESLGYVPDARMDFWMARVREAKKKDLLPIAWLNTTDEKDAWQKYKFYSPVFEGARERCRQMGYNLEEIWTREPGLTMRRLSEILYQRSIEGVFVTYPARHLQLKWESVACVALGADVFAPRLHCVLLDIEFNLLLAIKMLKRHGFRRIGICLPLSFRRAALQNINIIADHLDHNGLAANRVEPFYHPAPGPGDPPPIEQIAKWIRKYSAEAIICYDNRMVSWLEKAGFRVPEDVGVAHLAVDDDVLDWAGVHSNRREEGVAAAELLVGMIRNHQFGVPRTALTVSIRGAWHQGKTVVAAKAAAS